MGGRYSARASPSVPCPGTMKATAGSRPMSDTPKLTESKRKLSSDSVATDARSSPAAPAVRMESTSCVSDVRAAAATRRASSAPTSTSSETKAPLRTSSTIRRPPCRCDGPSSISTLSRCSMVMYGPCTSTISISSFTTVRGSSGASSSAGSISSSPGCARRHTASSRRTVESPNSSVLSRCCSSRDHRRALANEASGYSAPSLSRKISNNRPSTSVSRIGALRTRMPSPPLRTQYVESPAANRNSAGGSARPRDARSPQAAANAVPPTDSASRARRRRNAGRRRIGIIQAVPCPRARIALTDGTASATAIAFMTVDRWPTTRRSARHRGARRPWLLQHDRRPRRVRGEPCETARP